MKYCYKYIVTLSIAIIIAGGGCAYFNTYYNARRLYNQAGRSRGLFPDTVLANSSEAALYQQALAKFAAVITKYPQSRWAAPSLFSMANAHFYRGDFAKAKRLYEDVWQYYPDSKYAAQARLNLAVLCWKLREYERAEFSLQSIAGANKRTLEQSAFLLPEISQSTGDFQEAAVLWEGFLFKYPGSDLANQARFQRARCLLATGDAAAAVRELEALERRRMKRAFKLQLRLLLSQAYESAQRFPEALAMHTRLSKEATSPGDIQAIDLSLARIAARETTFPQARERFLAVALKHPRTESAASARFHIAELWEREAVLDSAQAYYNQARQENATGAVSEKALKRASDIALLLAYNQQSGEKPREQSAILQFLLAEHYLFRLNQPDQALEKYQMVAGTYPELPIAAKAWFAAGWVQGTFKHDTLAAEASYRHLIDSYPRTRYANAAKELLGMQPDSTVADTELVIELAAPLAVPVDTTTLPAVADTTSRSGGDNPKRTIPEPPQGGIEPEEPQKSPD